MAIQRPPTADAILGAGFEVLSEDPRAPLEIVARRAEVGRATLHRHFPSRDDLLTRLAIEALDATDEATREIGQIEDAREALCALFDCLLPLGPQFHFLARVQIADASVHRRYAKQVEQLGELVRRLRAQGALAADVPDAWAVALADDLIWTAWKVAALGTMPLDSVAHLASRTFLAGLAPAAKESHS